MGRKEVHEEIARVLQEKIQAKIKDQRLDEKYKFSCSADANGIYFMVHSPQGHRLIGEKNQIEEMFKDIGLFPNYGGTH